MNSFKKILASLFLTIVFIFNFSSCSPFHSKNNVNDNKSPTSSTTFSGNPIDMEEIKNFAGEIEPGTTVKLRTESKTEIEVSRKPE